MVAALRNGPEIDRHRFVPVCGYRPGHFAPGISGLGPSDLGAVLGPKSAIFGRILKVVRALVAEPSDFAGCMYEVAKPY